MACPLPPHVPKIGNPGFPHSFKQRSLCMEPNSSFLSRSHAKHGSLIMRLSAGEESKDPVDRSPHVREKGKLGLRPEKISPVMLPLNPDEKGLGKQLGCMAGFLQLFDRHQRIYTPRRINSGSTSPSERSESAFPSSPESLPEKIPAKTPLPLLPPLLDSWKLREGPRLSLDSRLRPKVTRSIPAVTRSDSADSEAGKIGRPTSVVARLMGLDTLPEMRRSASASRASRDPYLIKPPDLVPVTRSKSPPPNYANDIFPDPIRTRTHCINLEIERKLRVRGIHEPAEDLETLKQILEASHLKGLLHSSRGYSSRPPIVVLHPGPKPVRRSEPAKGVRSRSSRSPDPNPRKPSVQAPAKSTQKKPLSTARSPALLERCDELLRSIAAFTSADHVSAVEPQPSPVSVLDSSFLGEEISESPIAKGSINEWEEDQWSQPIPAVGFDVPELDGPDFAYVYDILRFSDGCKKFADVYSLLEKKYGATDRSEFSVLHRRLIFDTVSAMVARKSHVSAWEAFSKPRAVFGGKQLILEVWLELRQSRERIVGDDVNNVTCEAIRKDMGGGDHGWTGTSAETSDAVVLGIERLLFKDLVAETIRVLADMSGGRRRNRFRRKLVF